MKKTIKSLLLIVLAISTSVFNNTYSQTTLILQPGADEGKDTHVNSNFPTFNYGTNQGLYSVAWTWSGEHNVRSFIQFDLSSIPEGSTILSANLSLYNDPTNNMVVANGKHSNLTASNASFVSRLTSPWEESTVNWNNQPNYTDVDQAILTQSTIPHQDYTDIDVLNMIQYMVNYPSEDHGFVLRLANEIHYSALIFASSDNNNSTKHPKLVITYTTSCQTVNLLSSEGKDAQVWSGDPTGEIDRGTNRQDIATNEWTLNGNPTTKYGLIDFDFSSIPDNAVIVEAKLSLFHDPISNDVGHSQISGSNEAVLRRITSEWEETVFWNIKPTSVSDNEVIMPASTSNTQDYLNIDVTNLTQDIINDKANSYGFLISLISEQYYRSLVFASGEHPNSALCPKLEICYTTNVQVSEIDQEQKTPKIYPNPNNGIVNIDFVNNETIHQVRITDLTGKTIIQKSCKQQTETINISNFNDGIYMISINSDNKIYKSKIVKK